MHHYHWSATPTRSVNAQPQDKWGTCVGFAAADAVKATNHGCLSPHFVRDLHQPRQKHARGSVFASMNSQWLHIAGHCFASVDVSLDLIVVPESVDLGLAT